MVQTNDPRQEKTVISLTITVDPVFSTSGEEELRIETRLGASADASTVIAARLPHPVKIRSVGHSFGNHAGVRLESIEPGNRWRVILTANAKAKMSLRGRVIIELRDASPAVFTLPAFIQVTE